MSFFRKLFGLKPKEYVDNTPYVPEKVNTTYRYTERDVKHLKDSDVYMQEYNKYKKEGMDLNESEINNIAKSIAIYLSTRSINVTDFIDENPNFNKKSVDNNTGEDNDFNDLNNKKENESMFDLFNIPHGQRDYYSNHTSRPITCKDFGNPNKHYTDWLNDKTNALGNHVVDDAKERFNDYMEEQRRIWEDW